MKQIMLAMAIFAGLAMGQSVASKDPVTVSTDIYYWKTKYDIGSTFITVWTNCSDYEATHFIVSLNWQAGADTGSTTKLVKRQPNGVGYIYVMVNAEQEKVVIPSVTVTPVKVQPMSTARYTMAGKEYVEP